MELKLSKDLSFSNENGTLTIPSKQYDTARIFEFTLLQDDGEFTVTLPACEVYLRILKADGTQFQGEECCYISQNDNGEDVIIIDTSIGNGNQILTAPGINKCEIHLKDTGTKKELTTWDFNIFVKERVHDGKIMASSNSWDGIDEMKKASEKIDKFLKTYEIYSSSAPENDVQTKNQYWIKNY